MKRLLAALAALLMFAAPAAAKAADPYLALDTLGPYHYGQTVTVTPHGDLPHRRGDVEPEAQIICRQGDDVVYIEKYGGLVPEQPATLHLGLWGLSTWDLNGGGAADCRIRMYLATHNAIIWTVIDIHVEA